jgi:hypothetical protein
MSKPIVEFLAAGPDWSSAEIKLGIAGMTIVTLAQHLDILCRIDAELPKKAAIAIAFNLPRNVVRAVNRSQCTSCCGRSLT